ASLRQTLTTSLQASDRTRYILWTPRGDAMPRIMPAAISTTDTHRARPAAKAVRPLLREADEQVAQVGGVRGVAQHRAHAEDLLDRAQRRAVGVVDGVLVPPALGLGREYDHADRAVGAVGLVPEDEERAVVGVGRGREDLGHLRRQPDVALQHGIVQRGA